MAEKIAIWTEGAPQPYGHYSQAIKMGNSIFISGQLPIDAKTGKPIAGDVAAQSKLVLSNLTAIMQSCGGQLTNVLKTTLYLVDLREFPIFDKVSKEFFFFLPPATTTVVVSGLPGGCRVCLDAIAELNPTEMKAPKML